MKKISLIGLVVVLGFAVFFTRKSHQDVAVYSVDTWQTAFHKSWPTYGLPLVEYELLLTMLRNGQSKQAIEKLEVLLDTTIYDAKRRRQVLEGKDLQMLDKSLVRAAKYRSSNPRPLDQETNIYWTAERQVEVDNFLRSFVIK